MRDRSALFAEVEKDMRNPALSQQVTMLNAIFVTLQTLSGQIEVLDAKVPIVAELVHNTALHRGDC